MKEVNTRDIWTSLIESRFNVDHRGGPKDEARVRLMTLDEELLSMRTAMAVAQQRRNMLVPACHIPYEILSLIFILSAQEDWYPSMKPGPAIAYDYGWIFLTHVCSYWRDVSIYLDNTNKRVYSNGV